jgi:hypothetical protein
MAKITVNGGDFGNIVMLFLYDKLLHPDEIIEADINEKFNAFAEVLMRRGMKAPLLQCYSDMDPMLRVRYRQIRDVFIDNDRNKNVIIEIRKAERPEVLEPGVFTRIKKFLKKIIVLGLVTTTVHKLIKNNKVEEK